MYEVEIKLHLKNEEEIVNRLKSLEYLGEKTQIDTYYHHPCRNFIETDEALRIRHDDTKQKITYKGPKLDLKSKSRKEIEISIADDRLASLLTELSFVESGIVKKKRKTWVGENYEIAIDIVEGLGVFIEIETEVEAENLIEKSVKHLHNVASSLGLDPMKNIRESYLELLSRNIIKKAN